MINVSLSFIKPLEILILLPVVIIASLWSYARFNNKLTVNFIPVVFLNFIFLAVWAFLLGVTHDESVHMHLAWLISQGMVPYKDFWQHSSPFLWILMAPGFAWLKPSIDLFDVLRIFAAVVFTVNLFLGWHIARTVWGERARQSIYLLVLSSVSLSAQFLLVRPDIFMIFFLLAAVALSLEIPKKRLLPSFLAGISVALAASFITKQYYLFLLPILAVFGGEKKDRAPKLGLYLLGLFVGMLPLFSYLFAHQILREYFYWVFQFNAKIISLSVSLPLGVVLLTGMGAYILWGRFRRSQETNSWIMLMAFCLSSLSSLTTTTSVGGGYYLAFWFFICAVLASGCPVQEIFDLVPSLLQRSIIFGLVAGVFLASNISHLLQYKNPAYSTEKKVVAQLLNYCRDDKCLMIAPSHPVFAHDATLIYSYWQFYFADSFSSVRKDIKRKPVAEFIMLVRPAVVLCRFQKRDFILDLFQKDLISAADYKKLVVFFKENYTQKSIGKQDYYIRNDKL